MLLSEALHLSADSGASAAGKFRAAARPVVESQCKILVSGLCSVGKSSFVGALWGDSQMLPTAVRDCTQTNTLIRVPAAGEQDRGILLSYLSRVEALDYATRDLSYYRISALLSEVNGPLGPRLDELPPEERLRKAVNSLRQIFKAKPELFVLNEPLSAELEKLEQFLAFLDSPDYQPGKTVRAEWNDRREHLMGRLREDARTLDAGKLLALRHVEIVRETVSWKSGTPQVVDSPWIPTYHNARRADLILKQGREADILVILALPIKFQPEPWIAQIVRERPELLKRILVVFNQIDTVDTASLFSREGFAAAYQENAESLVRLGFMPENLFLSCARLPFLEHGPKDEKDELTPRLIERLKGVLGKLAKLAAPRPESDFKRKLLSACDPADAGIESLRARLMALAHGPVFQTHAANALRALDGIMPLDIPVNAQAEWRELMTRIEKWC